MLPPCSQPILHHLPRTGNSTLDDRQPVTRRNPTPLLDRRSRSPAMRSAESDPVPGGQRPDRCGCPSRRAPLNAGIPCNSLRPAHSAPGQRPDQATTGSAAYGPLAARPGNHGGPEPRRRGRGPRPGLSYAVRGLFYAGMHGEDIDQARGFQNLAHRLSWSGQGQVTAVSPSPCARGHRSPRPGDYRRSGRAGVYRFQWCGRAGARAEAGAARWGDLLLAAPQHQVLRVLTLTRLIDVFPTYASVGEAARTAGLTRQAAAPVVGSPARVAVT